MKDPPQINPTDHLSLSFIRLGEHSAVLWKFNKFTDVTVKVNDEKFLAHKTVLSCYSRYLKNMLLESEGKVDTINVSAFNLRKLGCVNCNYNILCGTSLEKKKKFSFSKFVKKYKRVPFKTNIIYQTRTFTYFTIIKMIGVNNQMNDV